MSKGGELPRPHVRNVSIMSGSAPSSTTTVAYMDSYSTANHDDAFLSTRSEASSPSCPSLVAFREPQRRSHLCRASPLSCDLPQPLPVLQSSQPSTSAGAALALDGCEPPSLFSSHQHAAESSSLGISTSDSYAVAGTTGETALPSQFFRFSAGAPSTSVRSLRAEPPVPPPTQKNPASVFERWVQPEVTSTPEMDDAILRVAGDFDLLCW